MLLFSFLSFFVVNCVKTNVCVKALQINTWTQHRLTKNLDDRTTRKEFVCVCLMCQSQLTKMKEKANRSDETYGVCYFQKSAQCSDVHKRRKNENLWNRKDCDDLQYRTVHPIDFWIDLFLFHFFLFNLTVTIKSQWLSIMLDFLFFFISIFQLKSQRDWFFSSVIFCICCQCFYLNFFTEIAIKLNNWMRFSKKKWILDMFHLPCV